MVFYKQNQPYMKSSARDEPKADYEDNSDPFRAALRCLLFSTPLRSINSKLPPVQYARNETLALGSQWALTDQARTRPSVSNSLPCYLQKREASSSLDRKGSHHGEAVDNERRGYLVLSSSWGSQELRIAIRGIHDELEAFCSEDIMQGVGMSCWWMSEDRREASGSTANEIR